MKNLVIVGTGGFARELFDHARNSVGYGTDFQIKGIVEGNIPLKDKEEYALMPVPILDNIDSFHAEPEDVFACAVANPEEKEKVVKSIQDRGWNFLTLIHKTAVVSNYANIGKGVILCPFTFVSCNTTIGDYVILNAYTSIGHDTSIGAFSSLMSHVDVTGSNIVGTHTYWGSGSRSVPGCKIGNYAKIGAGSLVIRKIKDRTTVFGVPAIATKM